MRRTHRRGEEQSVESPTTYWARRLGEERYVRDQCAVSRAESETEAAERLSAASVERWQAIVESMRRLVDAYNGGVKRLCVSVVEQSGQPTVTVTEAGEGTPYLTAALEDTVICIRGRDAGGGAHATEVRLRADRSDAATAAYVLQNWMQRL